MPWQEGKTGIYNKIVRQDDEEGSYLGVSALDPFVSTGVHQHLGTATSFFLEGLVTDYQGIISAGQAGINLAGATHDATAYQRSVLVYRLEGPVIYPPADEALHALHPNAKRQVIVNKHPEVLPDINITVDKIVPVTTSIPHVARQMIFDYTPTKKNRPIRPITIVTGCPNPAASNNGPD